MNANEFYNAACQGDLARMKHYLAEGGHVDDYAPSNQWNALGGAVYNARPEAVQFLIEQGASPFLLCQGKTPREWAVTNNRCQFVEILKRAETDYIIRTTPEWSLLGSTNLVHISLSPHIDRKLTEIFNFESRQLLTTYENTKTGEEKMLPVASFDDLDEKMLQKNLEILTSLGGKANPDTVFRRTTHKKNALPREQ